MSKRRAGVVLIVGLAALLRFADLGTESFWLDEVVTARLATGSLGEILHSAGTRPGLYVLLAYASAQLPGTRETALRSLSALAGTVGVLLLIVVGRRLFDERTAMFAALFMAVSEFQIYYAQDARYYALFVAMTLASMLAYLHALERGSFRAFAVHGVVSALLFYSHQFGIFVTVAQDLHLAARSGRLRRLLAPWSLARAILAVSILPVALVRGLEATTGGTGPQWLPPTPLWWPAVTLGRFALPSWEPPGWRAIAAALSVLALGWILSSRRAAKGDGSSGVESVGDRRDALTLLGLWLACPIALPLILSQLVQPMYHDRYAISASPALYLAMALVVLARPGRLPPAVALTSYLVLVGPSLLAYYERPVKEQWREAAAFVEQNDRPSDVLLFAELAETAAAFRWYYRGPARGCLLAPAAHDTASLDAAIARCTGSGQRFWLILRDAPNPDLELRHRLLGARFLHRTEQQFVRVSVYLLEPLEASCER